MFAQADTYEGRPGDPQSLNPYAYAIGNPFKYHDPTGHDQSLEGRFFSDSRGGYYTSQINGAMGAMRALNTGPAFTEVQRLKKLMDKDPNVSNAAGAVNMLIGAGKTLLGSLIFTAKIAGGYLWAPLRESAAKDLQSGAVGMYNAFTKGSFSQVMQATGAALFIGGTIAAGGARGGAAEAGALPEILAQISEGKSIQAGVTALNDAGATQAQAVGALTQIVANSGRHLVPATLEVSPVPLFCRGLQFVEGGATQVVVVAADGAVTYGSAIANTVNGNLVVSDFIPH